MLLKLRFASWIAGVTIAVTSLAAGRAAVADDIKLVFFDATKPIEVGHAPVYLPADNVTVFARNLPAGRTVDLLVDGKAWTPDQVSVSDVLTFTLNLPAGPHTVQPRVLYQGASIPTTTYDVVVVPRPERPSIMPVWADGVPIKGKKDVYHAGGPFALEIRTKQLLRGDYVRVFTAEGDLKDVEARNPVLVRIDDAASGQLKLTAFVIRRGIHGPTSKEVTVHVHGQAQAGQMASTDEEVASQEVDKSGEYPDESTVVESTAEPPTDVQDVSFPVADAFSRLPYIREVEVAETENETEPETTEEERHAISDYRFDAAAHFPLPRFGMRGEPMHEEGAIIYEGMQFKIYPDGMYRVRFLVGATAMPVVLRMQLTLCDDCDQALYTLTLPPITVPSVDAPREIEEGVHVVHHEGYLPVLEQHAASMRVVRRNGTARFGFGVDVP